MTQPIVPQDPYLELAKHFGIERQDAKLKFLTAVLAMDDSARFRLIQSVATMALPDASNPDELPPEVQKALDTFQAQDRQELDWVYDGGDKDARHVATTLARHLLKSARPTQPTTPLDDYDYLMGLP